MRIFRNIVIPAFIAVSVLTAAEPDRQSKARSRNNDIVTRTYSDNLRKYKGNSDVLVLPGLIADRAKRRVILQAESTGLGGGEIIEFFLVARNSGHAYEALAVSFAKPSHVHRALVFMGMEPGRPVDARNLHFWPRGERVFMTFACADPQAAFGPVPVERLVIDKRTNKPLAEEGLVFVGSTSPDSSPGRHEKSYAADIREPRSIASNYNEPSTVLDVRRQAPQAELYSFQQANPALQLPPAALLEVVITPEYGPNRKRVLDLDLYANPGGDDVISCLEDMLFRLRKADGQNLVDEANINEILSRFSSLTTDGHDVFVTLFLGNFLTLKAIRDLCRILSSIDTETGIRMEAPPPGHLYYRAFLPKEEFRQRSARIVQPWELHLSGNGTVVTGRLSEIEQIWRDEDVRPHLKVKEHAVATPEALRGELDNRGPGLRIILVFAQPSLTYGQLMTFLRPVMKTHPTIHVYQEEIGSVK